MFEISKKLTIHFIGIGGIGMSGIAEILLNIGHKISGSDVADGPLIEKLRKKGAEIFIGHKKENIENAQIVVYSSAIARDNPEIQEAFAKKIPVIKRAEMLAELMRLKFGIAIAGSHGKTTTTSMISTMLSELYLAPTCIVGGIVHNIQSHAVSGSGNILVAEADESDGSFLHLNPIMSVITNIDNDHLDHYKKVENIKKAFVEFANKIPFYSIMIINVDDKHSSEILSEVRRRYAGISVDNLFADYRATQIQYEKQSTKFQLIYKDESYPIHTKLSGKHNVYNTLCSIALVHELQKLLDLNISLEKIIQSCEVFRGVGRRFEVIYENPLITVFDDYAHHPTEIKTTVDTFADLYSDVEKIVIFEPHRYSRMKDCWNEFLTLFNRIDKVYIAPVYAASEAPIEGIDSYHLVQELKRVHPNVYYFKDWNECAFLFENQDKQKKVILGMGAGSISKQMKKLVHEKIYTEN